MPPHPLPRLAIWLIVPLCYYAGAKLGVWAAAMPEGIAILWPPNSVLLTAMLLARGRSEVLTIALLGIAAEVAADLPTFTLTEALIFGVANACEAVLASQLLKAWRFDPQLSTLADLRKFVLAGPLIAAPLAASIGAGVYAHFRGGDSGYLEFLRIWWMGDAMGLLIFTPLLLALATGGRAAPERAPHRPRRAADALVLALGAVLTLSLLAPQLLQRMGLTVAPVLVIPCVVYVAARFELRMVSGSIAFVGLVLAFATARGFQPFGPMSAHEASMRTQEFILTMSLLGLSLAALLSQLRERQHELHLANAQLDELNRELELRVAERTAQLDASNRQLQQLAMTDTLTGLPNRRAWFATAQAALNTAQRHDRALSVVMIDIDHFKVVNDTHGHAAGDAVLRHVASTLHGLVRSADVLARHGGEEFILLAPETDLDSAAALAERMRQALRAHPLAMADATVTVTASFGVTTLGGPGDDIDQLVQRADAALYDAKEHGRNRVCARPAPPATPRLHATHP